MQTVTIKVINEVGLHARPAGEFVKQASKFEAEIIIRNVTRNTNSVNAKSILSILTLGVEQGQEIEITADGVDEEIAVQTLKNLIETDFKE